MLEWTHPEAAQSMFSLAKGNNGFFRSAKQRDFIMTTKRGDIAIATWGSESPMLESQVEFFKTNFGIPANFEVKTTDRIVDVEGYIRWADYGRKSLRRVCHMFVLDEFGCRGQFKIKFGYDDKHGSSWVEESKTEVIFTRDASLELPVFVETPKPVVAPSEWIGEVGKRQEFEGTIVHAACIGESYWGMSYITKVKCGDSVVTYFGLLEHIDYRGPIKFKATVKAHDEYQGVKQTVVQRPKVLV